MKKMIFLLMALLFLPVVLAVEPQLNNVSESNFFIGQSGVVNVSRIEFENENCLRFFDLAIPSQYQLWFPPGNGVEVGRVFAYDPSDSLLWQGRILTTVNPNLLSYWNDSAQIGEIAVSGSVLRYNFYDGNNPVCMESANVRTVDSFSRGILTNPDVQGSYVWNGRSELSNDPTVYDSGSPFTIVYDYLTYYQTNQSVTNYNFECVMNDNGTITLNATFVDNETWNFILNQSQNQTNNCIWNVSQVNNNDNICQVNTTVDVPDVYLEGSVQICNGSTFVNVTDADVYNQTFLADLFLNTTNLVLNNQSFNYSCTPRIENYFNWSFPNGTDFNYTYLVQNNMSLSGFSCPANTCTCNCNPPSCPSDNIINQYNFTMLPQIVNTYEEHKGAFWFIGGVLLLAVVFGIFWIVWKNNEKKPKNKKEKEEKIEDPDEFEQVLGGENYD